MFMFICTALPVIQLLHVSPGNDKSFLSLATPVLFSVIKCFLVMLCFFKQNKPETRSITSKVSV